MQRRTPQPPCGTVWPGLLLNPAPSSPSVTFDRDPPRPQNSNLTCGTGSPLQQACLQGALMVYGVTAEQNQNQNLTHRPGFLSAENHPRSRKASSD